MDPLPDTAELPSNPKSNRNRIIAAAIVLAFLVTLSYFLMGSSESGNEGKTVMATHAPETPHPTEVKKGDTKEPVTQTKESEGCDAKWTGFKRAGLLTVPKAVKKLIINIGSWKDPPISGDSDTYTMAIEPQLKTAMKIADHPRLLVVTAAVSDVEGLAFMHAYGSWGESSSLTPANKSEPWEYDWAVAPQGYPSFQYVPVLSLRTIIESIPDRVEIVELKTDMQGHDFAAISHAGKALRRIAQIHSEVYCGGFMTYEGVKNDYKDFMGFMPTVGFNVQFDPCGASRRESDATFTRDNSWVDKGN